MPSFQKLANGTSELDAVVIYTGSQQTAKFPPCNNVCTDVVHSRPTDSQGTSAEQDKALNSFLDDQRKRYDEEAERHSEHYGDAHTQAYRTKFIREPLFRFSLENQDVLDAMSASGIETGYLLERGASVVGLDISASNAEIYRKKWSRDCLVESIHQTGLAGSSFDAVYICGGLHHVIPLLDEVLTEIHRILKPGGVFYFVEPNKDTWVDRIREIWYEKDSRFQDEEEAISYRDKLSVYLKLGFQEECVIYGGNIAYLVIGQSLALGIPKGLKRYLAPPLFVLERIMNVFPFAPKLFFAAAWRKQG